MPSSHSDDCNGEITAPIYLESIAEEAIDESVFVAEDECGNAKMPATTTKHGLSMEFQNALSVVCCEKANTKDMK